MAQDTSNPARQADDPPVFCALDEMVDTGSLNPNPLNPNRHSPEQVALLAKIIQSQGWRVPITVSNRSGLVVRGHCRLLAAEEAGLKEVPVDYQDYAGEADELADLIADNRLSELSEIDDAALRAVFSEIEAHHGDLDLTGFDTGEVYDLLRQCDAIAKNVAGTDASAEDAVEGAQSVTLRFGSLTCKVPYSTYASFAKAVGEEQADVRVNELLLRAVSGFLQ